jgi:hypothetical protein
MDGAIIALTIHRGITPNCEEMIDLWRKRVPYKICQQTGFKQITPYTAIILVFI